MSYSFAFRESALKEWKRLDPPIREQFKKKLAERLQRPRVESARLSGMPDCYKIKLKSAGYRLVYQVEGRTVTIVMVAVGRCEHNLVYKIAAKRA